MTNQDDGIPFAVDGDERCLMLFAKNWPTVPNLVHGFSARCPDGLQTTDIAKHLGVAGTKIETIKQVHSDRIQLVTGDQSDAAIEADGMLTNMPNRLLTIRTADCVPVLISVPRAKIVGAIHAGLRGTAKGICAKAITLCKETWNIMPEDIWVAMGPSISGCCYEIEHTVAKPLLDRWGDGNDRTWRKNGHKGYLDLRSINRNQLTLMGIPSQNIENIGCCTHCHPAVYESYRRDGPKAGRHLSTIGWTSD